MSPHGFARYSFLLLAGLAFCSGSHSSAVAQIAPSKQGDAAVKTVGGADDNADMGDAELDESCAIEAAAAGDKTARPETRLKAITQPVVKDPAMQYTDPRTYRVKVGFRVKAAGGRPKGVTATGPIPIDWPEQEVRLVSEKITPGANIKQQVSPGQRATVTMQMASLAAGESAQFERVYEITRYRMKFQLPPEEMTLAKQTPSECATRSTAPPRDWKPRTRKSSAWPRISARKPIPAVHGR